MVALSGQLSTHRKGSQANLENVLNNMHPADMSNIKLSECLLEMLPLNFSVGVLKVFCFFCNCSLKHGGTGLDPNLWHEGDNTL